MHRDFLRAAAVTPPVTPAHPQKNAELALRLTGLAQEAGLIVLPELCLTGSACGDLFFRADLLNAAEEALAWLIEQTKASGALIAAGLPVRRGNSLYNCAAVFQNGWLLGVVPQSRAARPFSSGAGLAGTVSLCGGDVPFEPDLLFSADGGFCAAFEIGADLRGPLSPAERCAASGAAVIGHLSAEEDDFHDTVRVQSARLTAGYIASGIIAENGAVLALSRADEPVAVTEIDLGLLAHSRRKTAAPDPPAAGRVIPVSPVDLAKTLIRAFPPEPFVPQDGEKLAARCREVLDAQRRGLQTRLARLPGAGAVVAVSGGLDSTLALLVAHRAAEAEGRKLTAVTMPGPGTAERSLKNAKALCGALGAALRTIPIGEALKGHLNDIGHGGMPDIVYENAQARERTQIVMDIANAEGAIVVGSSDLSETALGFTTYGGDQMSMYNVNASLPKTLMRRVVRFAADRASEALREVLYDIIDAPASPELLPLTPAGAQEQRSEELLGDYILHDFYLYWFLRHGYCREKLSIAAGRAFAGRYAPEALETALDVFLKRFARSQFKRNVMPDGPRLGGVSLSQQDWRMPADLAELP